MPLDPVASVTSWRAHLALGFERRARRTVLARRGHDGPLVVQKALHPEGEAVCHAIVVHPPAGIAGGDELLVEATVGPGAHALLTTPGAGKWYRTSGAWASQRVRLDLAAGARLEWLPQETILFDGARARIAWHASLAPDARLIAWDLYCLGRTASGEGFARGECALASRLERAGRPQWIERGHVAPASAVAASPVGLGRRPVFGTMVVAAPEIADEWVARAREGAPREGEGAVTRIPGVLLARYRGDSAEAARDWFTGIWRRLRPAVLGREAVTPRIWRT